MSQHPANKRRPLESPPVFVLAVIGILILLAHLAASIVHSNWSWGLNHFFFLPQGVTAVLIVAGCMLCVPPVWSRIFLLQRLVVRGGRLHLPGPLASDVIVAAVLGIFFWLLRTPSHFLGDGQLLLRLLAQGIWTHPHEPLDRLIHFAVLRVTGPALGWDAPTVYAVTSVAAGIWYCFVCLRLGRLLGHRLVVAAFLVTLGTVQLFLGYAESYSLATAMILTYMLLALESLAGRRSLIWPGIALLVGVMLHNALGFLIPSFVYLSITGGRDGGFRRLGSTLPGMTLVVVMAATILVGFLLWGNGDNSSLLVPLSESAIAQYTFFSLEHMVDFMNEQVLISPMAWIIAIVFAISFVTTPRLRRSRRFRFLMLAGLFPILFNVVLRPGIGGSRDWDLWSMGCLPYAVCAAFWLARGLDRVEGLRYVAAIVIAVGTFHVIPWIAVNRSMDLSLEHFSFMLENNPLWTERRIAAARHELGSYYYDRGEFHEAAEQIGKAVEAVPEVARYWMSLGLIEIAAGSTWKAESYFRKALELDPGYTSAYNNLGRLLMQQGRLREAERELRRALEIDPSNATAHMNIGRICEVRGDQEGAAEAYRRAVEAEPSEAAYWYYLALVLEDMDGPEEKSLNAWREVRKLAGRDPAGQEMLDAALMRLKASQ